jgi:hypothetical protein
MPHFNFAIKRGDAVVHSIENVRLGKPADAWSYIEKLSSQFDTPGLRVIVKDELGDVVIMAGLVSQNISDRNTAA